MNKVIILLVLSIIVFSCNKESKKDFQKNNTINFTNSSFSTISQLKGVELKNISDSILLSYRIKIDKDYMYLDRIKSDKLLNVIKLPEEEFIGVYGNKGRGPCEMIGTREISKTDTGTLLILDPDQKKVVEFNIDSLINNQQCVNEYKLDQTTYCLSILKKNNKLYYVDESDGGSRLFESNLKGENVKGYGTIEANIRFNYSKKNLTGKINNVFMANNKNLFAFAYHYYPLIELFDIEKNEWKYITGPTNKTPDNNFKGNFIYSCIRVTDKYIYTSYVGGLEDIDVNTIFVFNLKGDPIKKLVLDKGIFTFDIYNDEFIYGLNFEENKVLKFEISNDKT